MPISLVLQTIDRRVLERVDPKEPWTFNRILPIEDRTDPALPMLSLIDPYGDTIFNGLQMKVFIPEWDLLTRGVSDDEGKKTMAEVRRLAERCSREPHHYLCFRGD
jgi:hypothetical protein